eukprot:gnl/MRDRNA2_/MRDRNA2_69383_c0_seq1.p1 gnl/MRDRNA2_/MRDRNA2_69383_c0~~gnl/MRDRNA2_/MRDRNA2_69383_c0_seq1.p1  ORF type:complete len:1991 (+),score=451.62 gnl/MRDRNA2_/MRDRNA2_69383_c0_seq1:2-5974(+)
MDTPSRTRSTQQDGTPNRSDSPGQNAVTVTPRRSVAGLFQTVTGFIKRYSQRLSSPKPRIVDNSVDDNLSGNGLAERVVGTQVPGDLKMQPRAIPLSASSPCGSSKQVLANDNAANSLIADDNASDPVASDHHHSSSWCSGLQLGETKTYEEVELQPEGTQPYLEESRTQAGDEQPQPEDDEPCVGPSHHQRTAAHAVPILQDVQDAKLKQEKTQHDVSSLRDQSTDNGITIQSAVEAREAKPYQESAAHRACAEDHAAEGTHNDASSLCHHGDAGTEIATETQAYEDSGMHCECTQPYVSSACHELEEKQARAAWHWPPYGQKDGISAEDGLPQSSSCDPPNESEPKVNIKEDAKVWQHCDASSVCHRKGDAAIVESPFRFKEMQHCEESTEFQLESTQPYVQSLCWELEETQAYPISPAHQHDREHVIQTEGGKPQSEGKVPILSDAKLKQERKLHDVSLLCHQRDEHVTTDARAVEAKDFESYEHASLQAEDAQPCRNVGETRTCTALPNEKDNGCNPQSVASAEASRQLQVNRTLFYEASDLDPTQPYVASCNDVNAAQRDENTRSTCMDTESENLMKESSVDHNEFFSPRSESRPVTTTDHCKNKRLLVGDARASGASLVQQSAVLKTNYDFKTADQRRMMMRRMEQKIGDVEEILNKQSVITNQSEFDAGADQANPNKSDEHCNGTVGKDQIRSSLGVKSKVGKLDNRLEKEESNGSLSARTISQEEQRNDERKTKDIGFVKAEKEIELSHGPVSVSSKRDIPVSTFHIPPSLQQAPTAVDVRRAYLLNSPPLVPQESSPRPSSPKPHLIRASEPRSFPQCMQNVLQSTPPTQPCAASQTIEMASPRPSQTAQSCCTLQSTEATMPESISSPQLSPSIDATVPQSSQGTQPEPSTEITVPHSPQASPAASSVPSTWEAPAPQLTGAAPSFTVASPPPRRLSQLKRSSTGFVERWTGTELLLMREPPLKRLRDNSMVLNKAFYTPSQGVKEEMPNVIMIEDSDADASDTEKLPNMNLSELPSPACKQEEDCPISNSNSEDENDDVEDPAAKQHPKPIGSLSKSFLDPQMNSTKQFLTVKEEGFDEDNDVKVEACSDTSEVIIVDDLEEELVTLIDEMYADDDDDDEDCVQGDNLVTDHSPPRASDALVTAFNVNGNQQDQPTALHDATPATGSRDGPMVAKGSDTSVGLESWTWNVSEDFCNVSVGPAGESLKLPRPIYNQLYGYQHHGVAWMWSLFSSSSGGILADEMGLGKTVQACAFMSALKATGKGTHFLVATPVTLLEQWRTQVQTWCRGVGLNVSVMHGGAHERHAALTDVRTNGGILITSHDLLRCSVEKLSSVNCSLNVFAQKKKGRKRKRSCKEEIDDDSHGEEILSNQDPEQVTPQQPWDVIFVDEAQKIKNPSSSCGKALRRIKARSRVLLSATPLQNQLNDLWALMDFAQPGLLGNLKTFHRNFADLIVQGCQRNADRFAVELRGHLCCQLKRVIAPYFLRRMKEELKEDVKSSTMESGGKSADLPRKLDVVVWVKPAPAQSDFFSTFLRDRHKQEKEESQHEDPSELSNQQDKGQHQPNSKARGTFVFQAISLLKKVCNHPLLSLSAEEQHLWHKHVHIIPASQATQGDPSSSSQQLAAVQELQLEQNKLELQDQVLAAQQQLRNRKPTGLEDLLDMSSKLRVLRILLPALQSGGHRVLIFSGNTRMLDLVQLCVLRPLDLKFLRIDGSLEPRKRDAKASKFQANNEYFACCLNTVLGGTGLNLTAADRVVLLDPAWNPAVDEQAIDRVHRIGQAKEVVVYRLISAGTIEDKIFRRQVFKRGLAKVAFEKENQMRFFTIQELKDLLELPVNTSVTTQQLMAEKVGMAELEHPDLLAAVQSDVGSWDDETTRFWQSKDVLGLSDYSRMFTSLEASATQDDSLETKAHDMAQSIIEKLKEEEYIKDQVIKKPLKKSKPSAVVEPVEDTPKESYEEHAAPIESLLPQPIQDSGLA